MKTAYHLSDEILSYIIANTDRETLKEKSTKDIADEFAISTKEAYDICNNLASDKAITKLDPVNGNKFECCGWIANN